MTDLSTVSSLFTAAINCDGSPMTLVVTRPRQGKQCSDTIRRAISMSITGGARPCQVVMTSG